MPSTEFLSFTRSKGSFWDKRRYNLSLSQWLVCWYGQHHTEVVTFRTVSSPSRNKERTGSYFNFCDRFSSLVQLLESINDLLNNFIHQLNFALLHQPLLPVCKVIPFNKMFHKYTICNKYSYELCHSQRFNTCKVSIYIDFLLKLAHLPLSD